MDNWREKSCTVSIMAIMAGVVKHSNRRCRKPVSKIQDEQGSKAAPFRMDVEIFALTSSEPHCLRSAVVERIADSESHFIKMVASREGEIA